MTERLVTKAAASAVAEVARLSKFMVFLFGGAIALERLKERPDLLRASRGKEQFEPWELELDTHLEPLLGCPVAIADKEAQEANDFIMAAILDIDHRAIAKFALVTAGVLKKPGA